MSSAPIEDHELLRAQISQAEERLTGLERVLRDMDTELEGLSGQRERYELLEQVCRTLERLDELGAAYLFWGQDAADRTPLQVRQVRDRTSGFRARIDEIEQRRHALLSEIKQGQEVLDILEYDLLGIEEEEAERQAEWIVEREEVEFPTRLIVMPWARSGEDDRRYRKSLAAALLVALLLGSAIPFVDLPLPDLVLTAELPDRLANLIDERALPPPPPPVEELPPEEPKLPTESATEPQETVAEKVPDAAPEAPEPKPAGGEPAPAEPQVRSAGILAFRDSFSSLSNREPTRLGAQARINDAGEAAIGRTERAMLTTQAPGSSGGINLAALSRDVGGGGGPGIGGVEIARVASAIGPGGGGGSDRPLSGGGIAGRTDEEIQIVFDRYKAALYRLYNRELRNNPTLQGQIVLELTIEPDGSVSSCAVRSSDMKAPTLEEQVVERVRTFDFGAKEGIAAVTIIYPIDFLPAG
jgi:TonB family protein